MEMTPEQLEKFRKELAESRKEFVKLKNANNVLDRKGLFNPDLVKENAVSLGKFGVALRLNTRNMKELNQAGNQFVSLQKKMTKESTAASRVEKKMTDAFQKRAEVMKQLLPLMEQAQKLGGGGEGAAGGVVFVGGGRGGGFPATGLPKAKPPKVDPPDGKSGDGKDGQGGGGGGTSASFRQEFMQELGRYWGSKGKGMMARGLARRFGPVAMADNIISVFKSAGNFVGGNAKQGHQLLLGDEQSRMLARQTTGSRPRGVTGYGHSLGFSIAQSYDLYRSNALAMGYGSAANTRNSMMLMRARGLDPDTVWGLQSGVRHTSKGGKLSADSINSSLISGIEKGGFQKALTQEFVQSLSGVLQQLQTRGQQAEFRYISALFGQTARSLGGGFRKSPAQTAGFLQRTDQSMKNPATDAGKAFMLSALMQDGSSYFDAMRRMEKGVYGKGNMAALLKYRKQMGMGGDFGSYWLKKNLGGRMADYDRMNQLKAGDFSNKELMKGKGSSAQLRKEANKAGKSLYYQKRELRRQNKQRNLRTKADSYYRFKEDQLIKALSLLTTVIDKGLNMLPSWLGGKTKEKRKKEGGKGPSPSVMQDLTFRFSNTEGPRNK